MKRMLRALIVGAVLACSFGACRGEPTPDDAVLDAESLPKLTLVEELRLGSMDDPDIGFSRIGGAAVDRDGNLYVLDVDALEIRVFDEHGQLTRRIGGPGDGPGEFRRWPDFGVAGDTVWTFEMPSARLSRFLRDGTVLETRQVQGVQVTLQPGQWGQVLPRRGRADGLIEGAVGFIAMSPTSPTDEPVRIPRVVFNLEGDVVGTAGWYERRPPEAGTREIQVAGVRYGVPRPPPADPLQIPLVDGEVRLLRPLSDDEHAGAMTIARIGSSGDTLYLNRISYRPVPYDRLTLDSLAEHASRIRNNIIPIIGGRPQLAPLDEVAARALRAEMNFPRYQLPVREYWLGDDEQVWLRRETQALSPYRWILLDSRSGELKGEMELPRDARFLWSSGDLVWLMMPDEFDVPWVVRWRVAGL